MEPALFSILDLIALGFFTLAWLGYHHGVERLARAETGLNALMAHERRAWMEQMLTRDQRIVDAALMGSLQNGTAFFASTSLIAIGAALALLQSTDTLVQVFADLPHTNAVSRPVWEMKIIGLAIIFVYAFFKFSWSYRLFNYTAILIGATPHGEGRASPQALLARDKAAAMAIVASRHFNRGQRAFFFALAYLGWFVGPLPFMLATGFIIIVMLRRQFSSDARLAVIAPERGPDVPHP
jgi:uncharacterized membrane protein